MSLSVQHLQKYFGERALFSDITFTISNEEHVGFIGENGCGKTTLFRMLVGEESADAGQIVCDKDTRLGYMEQHACREPERTLWDEVESVFAPVKEVEAALQTVNDRLTAGEITPALLQQQHMLRERFEEMGGLYYASRVRSALLGLGFSETAMARTVGSLSGGQRSKAAMAKLLLSDANFLLLDEPTNHLDMASLEWLEEFLRGYTGAVIIISHDRYFLDRVTTRTLELAGGKLYDAQGSYSVYKEKRAQAQAAAEKQYKTAMREINRIEENIALLKQWNREKSVRAAESKEKAVMRLRADLVVPDAVQDTIHFAFSAHEVGGNEVLTAENLTMAFGDHTLFSDLTMHLHRGERVCLLGPNGCGKTTLLRVLLGDLRPQRGSVRLGAKVTAGYYDQTLENLHPQKTALEELADAYPQMSGTALRNALAAFLFRGDAVFRKVSALSGGEKARLSLLKLMLAGHNVLFLDEPTNHLDIASREALETALAAYDGTVLMVSHDRYFINRLATRVLRLTPEGCISVDGNYDTYLEKYTAPVTVQPTKPADKPNAYRQQKERDSVRRKLQTRIHRAEETVAALEAQIAALHTQLSEKEVAADYTQLMALTAELDALTENLDIAMQEWSEAQEAWEGMATDDAAH